MTQPLRLLAKSTANPLRPRPAETLPGHIRSVMAAADTLLEARGAHALTAVGLPVAHEAALRRIVLLGAFIHDLGKVSDHFQAMVRHRRSEPQLVRHEALTLLLSHEEALGTWLRGAVSTDTELELARFAAAGHHRAFTRRAIAAADRGAGCEIRCLVTHPDFAATLALGRELGLPSPPSFATDITYEDTGRRPLIRRFDALGEAADDVLTTREIRLLLAIAKAILLDADVAGSALRGAESTQQWIPRALAAGCDLDAADIAEVRLKGATPRDFQRAMADSAAPVTLVEAGCGTGKTAGAYLWAARHHGRQLWFAYPTTGTATEGFRDYLLEPDVQARLEHGRREVDIELLGLEEDGGDLRGTDRLDALRAWESQVIACTVDTVLGLLQNQRKGLYAFAPLTNSAIVFDEIHAYDARMFGILLRFLRDLPGVPVLLMTASLPRAWRVELERVVTEVHRRPLELVPGPEDMETLCRYRRLRVADPWPEVRRVLADGGKVLWVSNTVGRCMTVADQGSDLAPRIYHSRFRYADRVERHREVIDAFASPGAAFAVTTQVAEMSLDLSADLVVTDLAPVPALIQRLGRLNRRATPEKPLPPAPFVVLPVGRPEPYDASLLSEAETWLERLGDIPLSQAALAAAWVPDPLAAEDIDERSAWVDGGFLTEPSHVREGSAGLTVILPEDADAVAAGTLASGHVLVPMTLPRRLSGDWRRWPRVQHYPVPPPERIQYDPKRGATWL